MMFAFILAGGWDSAAGQVSLFGLIFMTPIFVSWSYASENPSLAPVLVLLHIGVAFVFAFLITRWALRKISVPAAVIVFPVSLGIGWLLIGTIELAIFLMRAPPGP
jgi:hypothetical protein